MELYLCQQRKMLSERQEYKSKLKAVSMARVGRREIRVPANNGKTEGESSERYCKVV